VGNGVYVACGVNVGAVVAVAVAVAVAEAVGARSGPAAATGMTIIAINIRIVKAIPIFFIVDPP